MPNFGSEPVIDNGPPAHCRVRRVFLPPYLRLDILRGRDDRAVRRVRGVAGAARPLAAAGFGRARQLSRRPVLLLAGSEIRRAAAQAFSELAPGCRKRAVLARAV